MSRGVCGIIYKVRPRDVLGSGRFGNFVRLRVACAIVTLLRYLWRLTELHLRRPLPRRQHVLAMRLFQVFGQSFPITLTYPNPLPSGRAPLSICLDLCKNHEIYVRMKGQYEIEWLRLIAAGMSEADCFVDVGAHIGLYGLTIAQAFPTKRVIAVEPVPENCEKLTQAIRLNDLKNVTAVPGVVAETASAVTFHLNPLHDGGGSLAPPSHYQTGDISLPVVEYQNRHPSFIPTLEVESVSLDSLVDTKSVIKIDVEGAEGKVLRSGERAFRKGLVDLAVVEVQADTFNDVVRFFGQVNFDCFFYGRRLPVKPGEEWPLSFRLGNLLCLRRGSMVYDKIDFR